MEELLKKKLAFVNELKLFTKEIMDVSVKTEYAKVDSMLEQREKHIESINNINDQINELKENVPNIGGKEILKLKCEIREVFKEVYDMDNLIRKNINSELLNIRNILNQPLEKSKTLNVKA